MIFFSLVVDLKNVLVFQALTEALFL